MYIIHLGSSNFPKGNAAMQRIRFTYRALKEAGYSTLVIVKESNYKKGEQRRIGHLENIPYIATSYQLYRAGTKVTRKLNNLTGLIGEFILLVKKRRQIDAAILYNVSSIIELIYYRIISKMLGFKLAFQYVEYRSSFQGSSLYRRTNDKLFDKYCSRFADGAIVISEFLRNVIKKQNSTLPLVKVPVICDFKEFDAIETTPPGYKYFLYCGSTEYVPVVKFVIELFEATKKAGIYDGRLVCVIGINNEDNANTIRNRIKSSPYADEIIMQSGLSYADLVRRYKSADLLLIPLRNSIQDTARFPHKISEYTASRRPFISTDFGELKYYFKNGESAILANDYTVSAYLEKLEQVLPKQGLLDEIGYNGYQTGMAHFHYQANAGELKKFFELLRMKEKVTAKLAAT
ncbi:MAG TPA: glycosyltransferase [Ferruginibacter sp.]|nr:glycosyltransferase [Ferruginibacter sp.]HMP20188.1 glycosyltransferase [Ferruginibacter sp.]